MNEILEGIPQVLPPRRKRSESVSHAPRRKDILSDTEKRLALENALRYFPSAQHQELAAEFLEELKLLKEYPYCTKIIEHIKEKFIEIEKF